MSRWLGRTAFVIASGPSLTREDCDCVERVAAESIAVNSTFRIAPWASVVYGCDYEWWRTHVDEVRRVSQAELWTQDPVAAPKFELKYIESQRGSGLSKGPGIFQGGNGGHQAIALAAKWGAKRIVLLGFDMQNTNGKTHWHGDHPPGMQKIPPFQIWIDAMEKLAVDLKAAGIETLNASRETALTCFDRVRLEDWA